MLDRQFSCEKDTNLPANSFYDFHIVAFMALKDKTVVISLRD
jgi:hypothetical protein